MIKELKEVLLDDFWIMPATPKYINYGIPYITSKNIKSGKIDFENVKYIDSDDYKKISKNRPILVDDILISMIGTLGEIAVVRKLDGIFYGQNMFLVRLDKDKIYQRYFINYFKSDTVKRQLINKQNKSTQSYLKAEHIERLKIPVPEIEEQKKIALKLDKIQKIIDIRKKQVEQLDELIKSQFVEMFENKNFDEEELIKLCRFIDYRGKTPTKCDNGIPLITAKNIKNNSFSFEPREYFLPELYESHMTRGIPKVGDVLFTTEAPLGNVCRIPEIEGKFAVGQRIITMQVYNKIIEVYLEQVLQSETFQSKMWKKSSGSTVKGIKSRLLEKITIPVPPIELQNKFAKFVNQVDKQKFEIQKSLEEIQKLQESLMNKYFGEEKIK